MRARLSSTFFHPRALALINSPSASATPPTWLVPKATQPTRYLANIRDDNLSLGGSGIKPTPSPRTVHDSDSGPIPPGGQPDNPPPDPRTVQLGKSLFSTFSLTLPRLY